MERVKKIIIRIIYEWLNKLGDKLVLFYFIFELIDILVSLVVCLKFFIRWDIWVRFFYVL